MSLRSYRDIDTNLVERADKAVQANARYVPPAGASNQDIAASLRQAGLLDSDREQIARHFPDRNATYRWFEAEGWKPEDSRDPDKPLLPGDYDMDQPGMGWFLVRIHSVGGTLERARQFIIRKRMLPYWPRAIRVVSRGNGKRKQDVTLTTSAFGAYAMVHMPWDGASAPFGAITDQEAKNSGVGGYVEFGRGPERIAASLVQKVAEMEAQGVYDHTKRKGNKRVANTGWEPQKGDTARVVDGPFASFNCIVEAFDDAKALIDVWVDLFGRAVLCHLELAQVAKL